MNSRDRLSGAEIRYQIERELEELLRHHGGLRVLAEKRRREEVHARLKDNQPLKAALESLIKKSPTLAALFLPGTQVSNPFKPEYVRARMSRP